MSIFKKARKIAGRLLKSDDEAQAPQAGDRSPTEPETGTGIAPEESPIPLTKPSSTLQNSAALRTGRTTNSDFLRKQLLSEELPAEALTSELGDDVDWIQNLAGEGAWQKNSVQKHKSQLDEISKRTFQMSGMLFELLMAYATEFNSLIGFATLKMTWTEPSDITEKQKVKPTSMKTINSTEEITYTRWRVSSRSWSV